MPMSGECVQTRGDDVREPWARPGIDPSLEDETAVVLLATLGAREQGGAGSVLEDFADALAGLGGALEVVLGADLLCYGHTLRNETKTENRHWQ